MTTSRHVMILASAGSGKTYALTNRFVSLLGRGARPERIVALTFTRKAAGEFFDEILHKLARAAEVPEYAQQLAAEIGLPEFGPVRFLGMLRLVVSAMPRLRLGTLDGFFARIVRTFPFELGLAGDFEVLEEHAARLERQRVLRRMFLRAPGGLGTDQKEFVEAFKRATFGLEEKRFTARLDAFLDRHQEIYLAASAVHAWGNAGRIWPNGSAWLESKADPLAAIGVLRDWLSAADVREKQRKRWEDFFEAAGSWAPGAVAPRELEYVLEKSLGILDELAAGATVLKFDKLPQELTAAAAGALAAFAVHVAGGELTRRLEMTRGIFAVLDGYESYYRDAVRRGGKLTFADVERLLLPMRLVSGVTDGEAAAGRLAIDFRLDGEIDHWLLDEFQDTSFGQWSILSNLVDEVVQDPGGVRSFFCVGDVKQAIYTWREGDPRLFREIFDHYNAADPGTIAEEHLDRSWRSGPALIELVNAIFGAAGTIRALFPGAASTAWNQEWRAHASAVPDRGGQAALLHAADEEGRWQLTVDLLREIGPLKRGLTCAILVLRNETAAALADFLREGGLPAVAESDLHVCVDNPLGAALVALVQAAAHPGDRLAWEHLRMSPLGAALARERVDHPDILSARLLGELHADGFERTMSAWLRRLDPALRPDDAFSRERARQFSAAAGAFDATGSRDPGEFVEFMERYTVRDAESSAVIRVMTVHKAKGLGFDLVILPDLEGQLLAKRREGLAVQKGPDRSVEWILDLPPKLFREHDPILTAYVHAAEASACYEKLSLLYVALTRAKRGLYVITEPVGTSGSANFARLLADTLGAEATEFVRIGQFTAAGPWSSGDPDWFAAFRPPAEPAAAFSDNVSLTQFAVRSGRRLVARRPSSEKIGRPQPRACSRSLPGKRRILARVCTPCWRRLAGRIGPIACGGCGS